METPSTKRVRAIFKKHGGILHTSQVINLGIHPRTLYRLRDEGDLVQVSRGVFRLASLPSLSYPDLVTVATRVPNAVVCLISALAYHEMTVEIPHAIYIALPRGTKSPRLDYPPIRIFRFSGPSFTEGIQVKKIDGVLVRIYDPEKTVVDCFRFRNKIGIDVAVEALNRCLKEKKAKPMDILHYARLCRIERIIRPYMEAIL